LRLKEEIIMNKKQKKEYDKIYNKINKEKKRIQRIAYKKNNKEKIKTQSQIYYLNNKERISIVGKNYRNANPEKVKNRHKKYREINKDKEKFRGKLYRDNNQNKIKTWRKANKNKLKLLDKTYYEKNKDKRKTDPKFRLNRNISGSIRRSLKNGNGKNGHHWETLVPYNLNDLIKRLKKTLPAGYTWDSYIGGKTDLSIDHIIPVSVHNFKSHTDTDFQKCWALKNLQLLPLIKNISKGAKLKKHFQPSLLI
jgi:hypothetical protein